jgi:hypothetical protein
VVDALVNRAERASALVSTRDGARRSDHGASARLIFPIPSACKKLRCAQRPVKEQSPLEKDARLGDMD